MSLLFPKRSVRKQLERIIPEAKRSGIKEMEVNALRF